MAFEKDLDKLFEDTKAAFEKSPIKQYAETNGKKWFYSISATRLHPGSNVIIGFNWGADETPHGPQTAIPEENFKDLMDKKWLGSLQRIYQPLKDYLPGEDIENCVQTNFCFFRSKREEEISPQDLQLSTPLFNRLLDMLQPKRIIGFSGKLKSFFIENRLCENLETADFKSNTRTLSVAKGTYRTAEGIIPVFFLPHPNAKFTGESRQKAWEFCFK